MQYRARALLHKHLCMTRVEDLLPALILSPVPSSLELKSVDRFVNFRIPDVKIYPSTLAI